MAALIDKYQSADLFLIQVRQDTGSLVSSVKVYDANAPAKFRIIKAWGVMTGAGDTGDKVKIDDGTTVITDDVDVAAKSDKDAFDFASIDDAKRDIAAGGTLQVVWTSNAICDVFMLCAWV